MLHGHLLNERYKIIKTIGGGGMADVYLAEDLILERQVAIKVLRMDYANDEEFIARFNREAQAAASLTHSNIVDIYDVGEEDQLLFMAMEYVNGMTLKEYIQHYAPLNAEKAQDIIKQIASAIAHAHENGIIHRDIKPQNILVDTYGNIKVTDFGIAMALSATSLTQTNSVMGSVHYLSPEQARGGVATKKSDIYSLGIVLYELLTGFLPFSGQSPVSIALQHLQEATPSVSQFNPNVPQSFENVVLKATAKDPFYRYDSVPEMEDDVATVLEAHRLNEEKFTVPAEEGEQTKAVPIITDDSDHAEDEGTMTNNKESEQTKPHKEKKNKKKSRQKKGKKKWFFITGFAVILLIVLFLLFLRPSDVNIPDVKGMSYNEAVTQLHELDLKTERQSDHSDSVEKDHVIRTDPAAGKSVKEDSEVTLLISQGEKTMEIQDYTGENYSQVRRILENKDFNNIKAEEIYSDKYTSGKIVEHVHPSPGSEVIPEETDVVFNVSKGTAPIGIRNVVGMDKQKASKILKEQGFKVDIDKEPSEEFQAGNVIRQDPETGTEMDAGETVNITLSSGSEEKVPIKHVEEIEVPFNPDEGAEEAEQTVKIYKGDQNHSIEEIFEKYTITDDKEIEIELMIEPDSEADYKIMRDDEVIVDKTISYDEVEGE